MRSSKSWPVGIAIIYITFVLFLVAFVIFSRFQQVDLVTEDYYDEELKYQQQIDRIDRAQSLSEPVNWTFDNSGNYLILKFPIELDPLKVKGNILFFRPSDAKQDKLTAINLTSENTQIISTKNLTSGIWKLKIFWKVDDAEYYKEGNLVIKKRL
jgi:hypothetical protein